MCIINRDTTNKNHSHHINNKIYSHAIRSAFARTGDVNGHSPGGAATVHWPQYTGVERLNMRLGVHSDPGGGVGVESTKGNGQPGTAPGTAGVCDFFDSIGYDW